MPDTLPPEAPYLPFGEVNVVKRTRFQKIVARTMTANASTIPHVTISAPAWPSGRRRNGQNLMPGAHF